MLVEVDSSHFDFGTPEDCGVGAAVPDRDLGIDAGVCQLGEYSKLDCSSDSEWQELFRVLAEKSNSHRL